MEETKRSSLNDRKTPTAGYFIMHIGHAAKLIKAVFRSLICKLFNPVDPNKAKYSGEICRRFAETQFPIEVLSGFPG